MEITTLSIRLLTAILVMMAVQADHSNFAGAVFARIVPDRRQFFEYDNVSVLCEEDNGISEWSVKWKSHKITNSSLPLNISASPCTIYPIFKRHSGEYWCENEKGERSEVVNISVTAGFVILESPTIPVMEGNDVTLNCTNKQTQSEHITDFYKDGVSLGTWYQSSMTIKNISKSDEGLYKCSISGAGESPESWLAVIKQSKVPHKETDLSHSHVPKKDILLWTVICALLAAMLLLLVGLLLHKRHKVSACFSSVQVSHSEEDNTGQQDKNTTAVYAVVRKQRKKKNGDTSTDPDDVLYATVKNHWMKKEMSSSNLFNLPGANPWQSTEGTYDQHHHLFSTSSSAYPFPLSSYCSTSQLCSPFRCWSNSYWIHTTELHVLFPWMDICATYTCLPPCHRHSKGTLEFRSYTWTYRF
ncbi:low affinity immunoglobulin gamma Fc region receptor II-a-like [Haplochromis burtoni]|uniref:low affinity immunoglobulin gamma Fc region receptor II-a-like n=1 Tax=Haplochromis burtoni TaxID=8153 RepID=UPI001C2D32CB|nr:low affinity immunoglobulin gamma Fc region receptor II-a-like [Haplochromis burtoni]